MTLIGVCVYVTIGWCLEYKKIECCGISQNIVNETFAGNVNLVLCVCVVACHHDSYRLTAVRDANKSRLANLFADCVLISPDSQRVMLISIAMVSSFTRLLVFGPLFLLPRKFVYVSARSFQIWLCQLYGSGAKNSSVIRVKKIHQAKNHWTWQSVWKLNDRMIFVCVQSEGTEHLIKETKKLTRRDEKQHRNDMKNWKEDRDWKEAYKTIKRKKTKSPWCVCFVCTFSPCI